MCDARPCDQAEYRRLLDEITAEYCKPGCYCILKEFLMASRPSRRLLVQLKLIDKWKWEESSSEGGDIGWKKATDLWVSGGHAARFAETYDDEKTPSEIYRQMMRRS